MPMIDDFPETLSLYMEDNIVITLGQPYDHDNETVIFSDFSVSPPIGLTFISFDNSTR